MKIRKDEEAVSPVIAIILMVAITVVLASVLYVWVMQLVPNDPNEPSKFATIDIQLIRTKSGDNEILVEHNSGNMIKWSEYQIIIENASNPADSANLKELTGELQFGETSLFTNNASKSEASYIPELNSIDLTVGQEYNIKIYDIDIQSQVLDRKITCNAG